MTDRTKTICPQIFDQGGIKIKSYPVDFWLDIFKIVELEDMRQTEDFELARMLNLLRNKTAIEQITDKRPQ
jgi:hypothetical protein